jgi:hypothetical protein
MLTRFSMEKASCKIERSYKNEVQKVEFGMVWGEVELKICQCCNDRQTRSSSKRQKAEGTHHP